MSLERSGQVGLNNYRLAGVWEVIQPKAIIAQNSEIRLGKWHPAGSTKGRHTIPLGKNSLNSSTKFRKDKLKDGVWMGLGVLERLT